MKGGLRLDSRAAMLQGGDTGPAVVPGEVDESLLILAIRHEEGLAMPPKKPKLPDAAIADFATWVKMGAPAPAGEEASAAAKSGVGRGTPALGVPAGGKGRAAGGRGCGLGEEPRGRLRPGEAGRAQDGSPRRRPAGPNGSAGSRST